MPLQTANYAYQALKLGETVAEKGNPNAASDAWVAALLLAAAVEGALANVRINLGGVADPELARGFREDAQELEEKSRSTRDDLQVLARSRGLTG